MINAMLMPQLILTYCFQWSYLYQVILDSTFDEIQIITMIFRNYFLSLVARPSARSIDANEDLT